MKILKDAMRGCRWMPHVGSHPGTPLLFILIVMGGLAGSGSSEDAFLKGLLVGSFLMAVPFGALYLAGAVARARLSDRVTRKDQGEA